MYDVKFLRGTQAEYTALGANANSKTFYYTEETVEGTKVERLYIGTKELTNTSTETALATLAAQVGNDEDATKSLETQVKALETLTAKLDGEDNVSGSIRQLIKAMKESLDYTVATTDISDGTGDVNVLTGFEVEDGTLKAGTVTQQRIKKVATTGAAEDLSTAAITDGAATPTQLYAASDVQETLTAIARSLNSLGTTSTVTVEQQATAEDGYASTYVIKQNNSQVGVKINIPKDYLVKSATVNTVVAADKAAGGKFENNDDFAVGDKYMDFTVNSIEGSGNESHLYINVDDLMEALSVEADAEEIQLAISATNELSATVVAIAASKINYSNTSSGSAVTETVQAALARLDGDNTTTGSVSKKVKDAIDALDADLDAASDASVTDTEKVAVVTGVTEANGVITAVDSIDVDRAGAASRAKAAVIGETTDAKTADTIKGVKNYIGVLPGTATADTIVGYIDEKTGDGIDALDSTAGIASVSNNVVTIKGGLVETDGIVTNAPTSGEGARADIVLEEVAVTGAAADVSLAAATQAKLPQGTATVDAGISALADALTWGTIS